jgi:hypothetical protein
VGEEVEEGGQERGQEGDQEGIWHYVKENISASFREHSGNIQGTLPAL